MSTLDDRRKKAKAERERARKRREAAAPGPAPGCACVLDGRDISALNTTLRARGLSDHDRYEVLKCASELATSETES
jgi:hypothetical protein